MTKESGSSMHSLGFPTLLISVKKLKQAKLRRQIWEILSRKMQQNLPTNPGIGKQISKVTVKVLE